MRKVSTKFYDDPIRFGRLRAFLRFAAAVECNDAEIGVDGAIGQG